MRFGQPLFFVLLILGISYSLTQTASGSTTLSYYGGSTTSTDCAAISLYADATHSSSFTVTATQNGQDLAVFCPGNIDISVTQSTSATSSSAAAPAWGTYSAGSGGGTIPHNFDSSTYSTLRNRIGSCTFGYYYFSTNTASPCYFSPSNGANSGITYYIGVGGDCGGHSGNGDVYLYCDGSIYINGVAYSINNPSTTISVSSSATVPVSMQYRCIMLAKGRYSGGSPYSTGMVYSNDNYATTSTNLNINVLNPLPSMSVSVSPSPITLTGGSASITLNVTNTGNVPIQVTDIVPNQGTFTPSSPFPSPLIAPGASLPITGTYAYSGSTPTTTTFTVSGASNVCGATYTATATASVSVISGCLYANISILGIMPSPIVFSGNTASVTLTIQNTGDVALNVTSFGASTDFTFTPSDTLPVEMSAGAARAFSGTLTYTGGSMPSNVTITAYGSTTAAVCGPSSVSSSITAQISTVTGVDLAVGITANDTSMTQLEQGYSNVTVRNIGSNATTSSSTLTVTIMHCNDGSLTDCPGNTEVNTYSIPALAAGASYIQRTIDYWCENYKYIGIRANATAPVSETDTTNNVDTIAIPCSMESCAISGPALIESPATYTFTAKCLRSDGSEMVCDDLLDGNFGWSRAANPGGTIGFGTENYAGDAFENYSLQITSITGNGTLSIDATATTQAGNDISCSNDFQVAANECVNQV